MVSASGKGIGTTYKAYECDWQNYELITINVAYYSNITASITLPVKAYFATTDINKRPIVYYPTDTSLYCEVYQNGNGSVNIRASEAMAKSQMYIVHIYGMIKSN